MKGNNDKELTARLQKNDKEAFNALYWKFHSAIYYNILKITRDIITAEDLVQEVFISLWKNRHSLDVEKEIAGWLFVVSYNKSISYLKQKLKESVAQTAAMQLYKETNTAEDDLNNARHNILEKAIQQLSPQKRRVFELCKLQRKTYEEASQELNISKHTVKEYLSCALNSIKKYIVQHTEHVAILIVVFYK